MKIHFLILTIGFMILSINNVLAQASSADSIDIELSGTQTLTQAFDSISTGLIKSRIPYGVLFPRVVGWSGGAAANTDTISSKYDMFQAWYDMEQSTVYPNTNKWL